MLYLFTILALTLVVNADAAEPAPNPKNEVEAAVKRGREKLQQAQYAEALAEFESALTRQPANKDTRVLAALAAYRARKPQRALSYFNQLLDETPHGGNSEFELVRVRVMTLNALEQRDAAELAIERLREIREKGRSKEAVAARGFVREHLYAAKLRGECWESFDTGNEVQTLYRCTVTRESDPFETDQIVTRYVVEAASLPSGQAGFVLSEEKDGQRRIYKRWVFRPEYDEVRVLFANILSGKEAVLEQKKLHEIQPAEREALPVPADIRELGLSAPAESIVFAAWRLRDVDAGIARLASLPAEDTAAVDSYLQEFTNKYPRAQRDLDQLIAEISRAKAADLVRAYDVILKFAKRSPYLEFGLLTAFETRNRDFPLRLLHEFRTSKDFIVREAASAILARGGNKGGLAQLFSEIEAADARQCEILHGALVDVLGAFVSAPPTTRNPDAARLAAWKEDVKKWRDKTFESLQYRAPETADAKGKWQAGAAR